MRKLWIFGCSHSSPYSDFPNHDGSETAYMKYKKFKGGCYPPTWMELLSKKLNLEVNYLSRGGLSNYGIFSLLCTNVKNIQANDIVIIEWTYLERFRLVSNNMFHDFIINNNSFDFQSVGGKEIVDNIFFNRTNNKWAEEIYDYENIIDELSINKNFDVFYWTVCDRIFQSRLVHKRELKKYLIPESNKNILNFFIDKYGAQTISMETNNEIPDDHLGEMGHQVIADKFYEDIISKI